MRTACLPIVALLLATGLGEIPAQKKLVTLTGEINDEVTSRPLPARVYIQGEDGAWHFPRSQAKDGSAVQYRKQGANPRSVETHTTLSPHPFVADLPPGKYTLTVERGHEYHPQFRQVVVGRDGANVTVKLRRWIDMVKRGWYSGETHVHRPLDELPNLMLAEDLNVTFPLVHWVTEAFTPPRQSGRGMKDPGPRLIEVDKTHVIYPRNTEYEIFTVGKQRHTLGAFFVLNHKTVLERGAPPVVPIAQQAHAEEALIDLDKPNWPWSLILVALMKVDLFELANNHVWRTEFGYPSFGEPAPEFMKVAKDLRGFTEAGWIDFGFKTYYALLNCGFPLRPSAGTASGVHPVPLGFGRVYVQLEQGFSYDGWVKGLNAGRSFVTTGPMLFVQVNGQPPGHKFKQAEKGLRNYRVLGSTVSARPLERIEIIVDGEVVQTLKPHNKKTEAGAYESEIDAATAIGGSAWLAVRCFEARDDGRVRFAHTAPVHFEVAGRPLRPRRAEVDFLIQRVQEQIKRSGDVLPKAALAEYREALKVYQAIAKRAR